MALIDSNNFITHLVWMGLIDRATCGELKEAIEFCTVKDTYSKADMVAMLRFLWNDIEDLDSPICDYASSDCISKWQVHEIIQQKINALEGKE